MGENREFKPRDPVCRRFATTVPKTYHGTHFEMAERLRKAQPLRWSIQRRMIRPRRLKVG